METQSGRQTKPKEKKGRIGIGIHTRSNITFSLLLFLGVIASLRVAMFRTAIVPFVRDSAVPQRHQRPRFAVISGFVTKDTSANAPRVGSTLLDHLVNKACYTDLWGYDYIFNTTWGFDKSLADRHWLDYGTWHRVPHMQAALAKYEWILYADTDYVFQDLTMPLDSFLKEWELYGKNDVHVLVPDDMNTYYTFSAFAVFIRNSPFGHRLLENWMELAKGLCKNGNFPSVPGVYEWGDSDQPGLWYALAKTHAEFYPRDDFDYQIACNNTTGLVETNRFLGPELNQYMEKVKAVLGSHGNELTKIQSGKPNPEQFYAAINFIQSAHVYYFT